MIWRNISNINIPTNDTEYKLFIITDYGSGKRTTKMHKGSDWDIEKFLSRMVGGRGIEKCWKSVQLQSQCRGECNLMMDNICNEIIISTELVLENYNYFSVLRSLSRRLKWWFLEARLYHWWKQKTKSWGTIS